jgi:adenosylcobinamide-GDP ribazoletransferase
MRNFLAAFQFLTIIPVAGRATFSEWNMVRSMAYYPLVGLCIGLILVLARHVFGVFFPNTVVAILLVVVLVLITGALHLDGLSDTIDGLKSGKSREEALRIMRDSHVGAFGVVGLACLLILKFTLLTEIQEETMDRSLLLMTTLGRWSMVQASYGSVYARAAGGLAKPFVEGMGKRELLVSTILALAVSAALLGLKGIVMVGVIGLLSLGIKRYFHWKLGGITGDILGATNETSEFASLLGMVVLTA